MLEPSARESNFTTDTITGNSARTTKGKVVGEKRKRFCYTDTQTDYLEQAFGKGDLNTKDGRQKVADVLGSSHLSQGEIVWLQVMTTY